MATSVRDTPPLPIQRPGLFVSVISLVLRIIGLLIASLLFSMSIDLIGPLLFWGDQGWRYSQTMLNSELGGLCEPSALHSSSNNTGKPSFKYWTFSINGCCSRQICGFTQQARVLSQGNGFWSCIKQL